MMLSRLGSERSISDIWSALGGELKPSLDLVIAVPFEAIAVAPSLFVRFTPRDPGIVARQAKRGRWKRALATKCLPGR